MCLFIALKRQVCGFTSRAHRRGGVLRRLLRDSDGLLRDCDCGFRELVHAHLLLQVALVVYVLLPLTFLLGKGVLLFLYLLLLLKPFLDFVLLASINPSLDDLDSFADVVVHTSKVKYTQEVCREPELGGLLPDGGWGGEFVVLFEDRVLLVARWIFLEHFEDLRVVLQIVELHVVQHFLSDVLLYLCVLGVVFLKIHDYVMKQSEGAAVE